MFYILKPASLRPQEYNSSVKLFGKPFIAQLGELNNFLDFVHQIIFRNQYHIDLIKENDVVVDAGANMGIFSIFVAMKHPNTTIYAFEPTPSTFEALKENVKYYPNIKIFNCGLGEKEGMASIIITGGSGANYIGEGGTPIEIKTIDGLNIPANFIKMDVEGYEGNVLKGAAETIKKNKPIIAMSAYHKPDDITELPKLLNSIAPYHCELHHDCEEDFICEPA